MLGVVLIVLALVIVGPIVVMLGGAIWSALIGWLLLDDADERAEGSARLIPAVRQRPTSPRG